MSNVLGDRDNLTYSSEDILVKKKMLQTVQAYTCDTFLLFYRGLRI